MKLTFLLPVLSMKPTNSLTRREDRGSGRILAWAIALLLLIPGAAFAGDRGSFPTDRCPGSNCPDNAQPKEKPCGQLDEDPKRCSREGLQ